MSMSRKLTVDRFLRGAALVLLGSLFQFAEAQESQIPKELPEKVEVEEQSKKATKKRKPAEAKVEKGKPGQRQLSFSWEPVEKAKGYQVLLTNKSNKKSKKRLEKIDSPEINIWIDPGVYDVKLRSVDSRGVPGAWDEPFEVVVKIVAPVLVSPRDKDKILSKDDETQNVKFTWVKVPGAREYQVEVRDTVSGDVVVTEKVRKLSHSAELSVAKRYEWRVTSILKNGDFGEPGIFGNVFEVYGKKLEAPEIEAVDTKFVRELSWEGPELAEGYSYVIYRKTPKGKWKKVEKNKLIKEAKIPFSMEYPGGVYKFRVLSKGDLWQSSKVSEIEFDVWNGDRSPAAAWRHEMRESLEKPTDFYAVGSYLLTVVDFQNLSNDLGGQASASASVVGGTGRIGLGYFFPDSDWGMLGIADLSGAIVDGENYTYASAELHGSWRTYWDVTQFRASGGLYYKEIPTQVLETLDSSYIENSNAIGLHAGFDLWYPFSHKLGVQLNARTYFSLSGTAANGQPVEPTLSYQLGFMGSYKLARNLVGFAGYAYRVDTLEYGVNEDDFEVADGAINEVSMEGHYLNLMMEWGF